MRDDYDYEEDSFEDKAQKAWNKWSIEQNDRLDALNDDQFFLVGDAFYEGYLMCIKELLTGRTE